MRDCPFCDYEGPSEVLADWHDAYVIEPLRQITPGHVLVVPKMHVEDFAEIPQWTARTFYAASRWWRLADKEGDCNLITSKGKAASQTVRHFHVHVVPRRAGDGLWLPWANPHGGEFESDDQRAAHERRRREAEPGYSIIDGLPIQKAKPIGHHRKRLMSELEKAKATAAGRGFLP